MSHILERLAMSSIQKLSEHEKEEIKKQISFMKEYRELIQFGTFIDYVLLFMKTIRLG